MVRPQLSPLLATRVMAVGSSVGYIGPGMKAGSVLEEGIQIADMSAPFKFQTDFIIN